MCVRVLSVLVGYLWGCVLTADIVARRMTGRSAFEVGDGNPGMANIGHELGVRAAALVLAGDILKTVAAFVLARVLFAESADTAGAWAVLGVTLGHNYPVWHRLRGGKGVATTCSGIILMSPAAGGVACLVGLAMVVLAGYLCWGAIAISVAFALLMAVFGTPDRLVVAIALLALMLVAHGGPAWGTFTGETPRAALSDAFWSRFHRQA